MAKHFIIINPFDSLVKVNDNVSDITKRRMLSIPEYCQAALGSFSLARGSEEIINFLNRSNSFSAVLVSAYPIEITRIVANHFGIKHLKIYEKSRFYSASYAAALNDFEKSTEETTVLTGHYGEIDEALEMGLSPIFFSETKRCNKPNCTNARNLAEVLRGLGLKLQ